METQSQIPSSDFRAGLISQQISLHWILKLALIQQDPKPDRPGDDTTYVSACSAYISVLVQHRSGLASLTTTSVSKYDTDMAFTLRNKIER